MSFIEQNAVTLVLVATGILAIMTVLSIMFRNKLSDKEKRLFFYIIVVPVVYVTLFMAGQTLYHNFTSETGGPVHWHADYQVWVCGERLDLINPTGLKNKIGTPLFHEHDDDRVHVEGTVQRISDVDVGSYFDTIGGRLTNEMLVYPTDDGIIEVRNGATCDDGAGVLKTYINGKAVQDPANYQIYQHPLVPPGDCVIVEFAPNLGDTTGRLCESWAAAGWNYDNYQELRGEADGN